MRRKRCSSSMLRFVGPTYSLARFHRAVSVLRRSASASSNRARFVAREAAKTAFCRLSCKCHAREIVSYTSADALPCPIASANVFGPVCFLLVAGAGNRSCRNCSYRGSLPEDEAAGVEARRTAAVEKRRAPDGMSVDVDDDDNGDGVLWDEEVENGALDAAACATVAFARMLFKAEPARIQSRCVLLSEWRVGVQTVHAHCHRHGIWSPGRALGQRQYPHQDALAP